MEKTNDQIQPTIHPSKVKLMCSHGGRIQPSLNDTTKLTYVGGDTKLLAVDHTIKFSEMISKLASLFNIPPQFRVKYQLPGWDLNALVVVVDDDDVENMIFEYDQLVEEKEAKVARIRLFLFGVGKEIEKTGSGSGFNPDFLFGFDKDLSPVKEKKEDEKSAFDLLQIPGVVVPGVSGSGSNESCYGRNVAGDGHVTNAEYLYRVPVPVGGGEVGYYGYSGMGTWEQPVYAYGTVPGMGYQQEPRMVSEEVDGNNQKTA